MRVPSNPILLFFIVPIQHVASMIRSTLMQTQTQQEANKLQCKIRLSSSSHRRTQVQGHVLALALLQRGHALRRVTGEPTVQYLQGYWQQQDCHAAFEAILRRDRHHDKQYILREENVAEDLVGRER